VKLLRLAAAVLVVGLAMFSGLTAHAEEPFFVASQPSDQVMTEGESATFSFGIDSSAANQRQTYYTWLQVETTKITDFNTDIPLSCRPFPYFLDRPAWVKDGQAYQIDGANCFDTYPSSHSPVSVMVSEPFTVNGQPFTTANY
jgi:hypothetical protein